MLKIYHNPRCSKSRETLEIIKSKGFEPEVVEYLKDPLSRSNIVSLLKKLDIGAINLVRKSEGVWKELGDKDMSDSEMIKLMVENPILIERPVVVSDKGAVIGRPPSEVLKIL